MEAFLVSAGSVTLAEIGDKTQLLAFMLAARFRKPLPVLAGILIATLANHAIAGAFGAWVTSMLNPETLRWILGLSFLAMAVWVLIPDRLEKSVPDAAPFGVFASTLFLFFLVEIGDKTQIATVALAARYQDITAVVLGTTLGMMIASVPAVLLGERIAHRIPVRTAHAIAAVLFAALGAAVILRGGGFLP